MATCAFSRGPIFVVYGAKRPYGSIERGAQSAGDYSSSGCVVSANQRHVGASPVQTERVPFAPEMITVGGPHVVEQMLSVRDCTRPPKKMFWRNRNLPMQRSPFPITDSTPRPSRRRALSPRRPTYPTHKPKRQERRHPTPAPIRGLLRRIQSDVY